MIIQLKPEFDAIRKDKYEGQLLKLFDFGLWVESNLIKNPLNQLLIFRKEVPALYKQRK